MKKTLILLFSLYSFINANDTFKINTYCIDNQINIKINSNKLNLSEDAIQDNKGGYVYIPEDNHYIKTETNLYKLNGVVTKDYKNRTNQLSINIDSKELLKIKQSKAIKLIQKINLEKENKRVTNILDIYFDNQLFNKAYKECLN